MIVYGAVFPHPPMIIPAIGGAQIKEVRATVEGMTRLASRVADYSPDLLVFITPHGNVYSDAVSALADSRLEGDFGRFGHRQLKYSHPNDLEYLERLRGKAEDRNVIVVPVDRGRDEQGLDPSLDHGVLVPLHYLEAAGLMEIPILAISFGFLSVELLYSFGMAIAQVAEELGRRVAVIASSDMSHRLKEEGPYSYHPDGPRFDREVKDCIADGEIIRLLELPDELRENAGECGFRSLVIMMGALDGRKIMPEVLSYEGPFGVGYLTAGIEPGEKTEAGIFEQLIEGKTERQSRLRQQESPLVQWARKSLETYVNTGKRAKIPEPLPEELKNAAAAFVSLKKDGQLRGCIGTLEPVRPHLALEIRENAIDAGTEDPRFLPVEPAELDELVYSVDVLSPPEPIAEITQLDPLKYGVIVSSGSRRGVLLPDLEGIDTPQQQVEIARQKAGIRPGEKIRLQRFEVRRFK